MTAQVIFLNAPYEPGPERRAGLRRIQKFLSGARIGLYNRIMGMHPYDRVIQIERHYATIRGHIRLEPSEDCKILADQLNP